MTTASTHSTTIRPPAAFRKIVCGVDGSPADAVAVQQAAVLAGPNAALELVSVVERPVSESARILLTRTRARTALRRAHELAVDAGAHPHEELVIAGWGENGALFDRCENADLLAIGTHGGSRVEGILAGRTCTAAVHRAPCPVLVARPVAAFPGTIMLADDGGGPSDAAAELATAIAARFGSEVLIASPPSLPSGERRRLAAHGAALKGATGREPVFVDVQGQPSHVLPELAERFGISLLVLGSRRLQGARALGSVSERVAHRTECSVLVVRH